MVRLIYRYNYFCLAKEMENGRYPNFQKLSQIGLLRECISIFPSITHAALTSIITGEYPDKHGVVASHWYDFEKDKVAYFSGSLGMMLQKGVGNFFREFLLELNNDHLKALTLFQKLERDGYETACINFPIYRGDVPHEVNMPLLLKWIPALPASTTIKGPKKLLLGDLITNPNGLLTFPDYPNAFERIASALDCPTSGPLWLTAKLGHELIIPAIKPYPGGGSHASLHRLDSQPPLIVAGAPENVAVPEFPRIIDIAPLCLDCIQR